MLIYNSLHKTGLMSMCECFVFVLSLHFESHITFYPGTFIWIFFFISSIDLLLLPYFKYIIITFLIILFS